MSPQEQLEVIEAHWYPEAQAFKAARTVLRTVMEEEARTQALVEVERRRDTTNALLDAYLEVSANTLD